MSIRRLLPWRHRLRRLWMAVKGRGLAMFIPKMTGTLLLWKKRIKTPVTATGVFSLFVEPLFFRQQLHCSKDPSDILAASKTLAEKAAWEFVDQEKPNFTISTINPPLVFGPIIHYLNSLDALNTSNQRLQALVRGEWKDAIPDTGVYLWVDVRVSL